jgi:hypothetical protein
MARSSIDWDALIKARLHGVEEWPTDEMAPDVLFICGYRRTGKDTFANDVVRGSFSHDWAVYASPEIMHSSGGRWACQPRGRWMSTSEFEEMIDCHARHRSEGGGEEKAQRQPLPRSPFVTFVGAERVAFADAIRNIVSASLGLGDGFDYEKHKDSMVIREKTIRMHLIDAGTAGRKIDPNYWVKEALAPTFGMGKNAVVCSDWRFVNEFNACTNHPVNVNGTSVRLFRPDVPVPAIDINSEHDLDGYKTDYLLIPKPSDFEIATKTFEGLYDEYILMGEIAAMVD